MKFNFVAKLLLGAGLLAGLGACGQKGPLYLPDKPGSVISRPAGAPSQTPQPSATQPKPTGDEPDSAKQDEPQ